MKKKDYTSKINSAASSTQVSRTVVDTVCQTQVGQQVVEKIASATLGKEVVGQAAKKVLTKGMRANMVIGAIVLGFQTIVDLYIHQMRDFWR